LKTDADGLRFRAKACSNDESKIHIKREEVVETKQRREDIVNGETEGRVWKGDTEKDGKVREVRLFCQSLRDWHPKEENAQIGAN